MNANNPQAVTPAKKKKVRDPRNGLRTSATLATIFTILGHTWLGFEQSLAHVFVALGTGYALAIGFEAIDARTNGRPMAFTGGGVKKFVDFLLPAHMTSITMAFLLYSNERLWVMAFGVSVAIGSKFLFRVRTRGRYRHFFNPSNFGIAVTLACFHWTTAIPWGYTVESGDWVDWALPVFIVAMGTRLNVLYTKRMPLIVSFVAFFILQGALRAAMTGGPLLPEVVGLTGVAFCLFIFYMITDPMTSPFETKGQVIFGASIGLMYGVLMVLNVQYAIFFSVTGVSLARGLVLYAEDLALRRQLAAVPAAK